MARGAQHIKKTPCLMAFMEIWSKSAGCSQKDVRAIAHLRPHYHSRRCLLFLDHSCAPACFGFALIGWRICGTGGPSRGSGSSMGIRPSIASCSNFLNKKRAVKALVIGRRFYTAPFCADRFTWNSLPLSLSPILAFPNRMSILLLRFILHQNCINSHKKSLRRGSRLLIYFPSFSSVKGVGSTQMP